MLRLFMLFGRFCRLYYLVMRNWNVLSRTISPHLIVFVAGSHWFIKYLLFVRALQTIIQRIIYLIHELLYFFIGLIVFRIKIIYRLIIFITSIILVCRGQLRLFISILPVRTLLHLCSRLLYWTFTLFIRISIDAFITFVALKSYLFVYRFKMIFWISFLFRMIILSIIIKSIIFYKLFSFIIFRSCIIFWKRYAIRLLIILLICPCKV